MVNLGWAEGSRGSLWNPVQAQGPRKGSGLWVLHPQVMRRASKLSPQAVLLKVKSTHFQKILKTGEMMAGELPHTSIVLIKKHHLLLITPRARDLTSLPGCPRSSTGRIQRPLNTSALAAKEQPAEPEFLTVSPVLCPTGKASPACWKAQLSQEAFFLNTNQLGPHPARFSSGPSLELPAWHCSLSKVLSQPASVSQEGTHRPRTSLPGAPLT